MIRKLTLAGLLMFSGVSLWAFGDVYRSSFTNTVDTTKNLCGADAGIVTNRRGFLHGVCVSSGTSNGTVSVFNSSATTINPIAVINSVYGGCQYFDVEASTINKGLTYSTTGNGNSTILYDCF